MLNFTYDNYVTLTLPYPRFDYSCFESEHLCTSSTFSTIPLP